MTTGERIKSARKQAGMTQKALGEELGISYQTVAQWENDLRNPKQETLLKIAKALGVHLRDLVDSSWLEEFDQQTEEEIWEEDEYDLIHDAILGVLRSTYKSAEYRIIADRFPIYSMGKVPNTFVLYNLDLGVIERSVKNFILEMVDRIKDSRPEDEIIQDLITNDGMPPAVPRRKPTNKP